MNIDTMEAGREMDALVAEKIMGWKAWEETRGEYIHVVWQKQNDREPWYGSRDWQRHLDRYRPLGKYDPHEHIEHGLPNFSSDISAAWEVMEKMAGYFDLTHQSGGKWLAFFGDAPQSMTVADTAPLAICRAALKAAGEEGGDEGKRSL